MPGSTEGTTLIVREGEDLGPIADVMPISENRQANIIAHVGALDHHSDETCLMVCRGNDDIRPGDLCFFRKGFTSNQYAQLGYRVHAVFEIPAEEGPVEPYLKAVRLDKVPTIQRAQCAEQ